MILCAQSHQTVNNPHHYANMMMVNGGAGEDTWICLTLEICLCSFHCATHPRHGWKAEEEGNPSQFGKRELQYFEHSQYDRHFRYIA